MSNRDVQRISSCIYPRAVQWRDDEAEFSSSTTIVKLKLDTRSKVRLAFIGETHQYCILPPHSSSWDTTKTPTDPPSKDYQKWSVLFCSDNVLPATNAIEGTIHIGGANFNIVYGAFNYFAITMKEFQKQYKWCNDKECVDEALGFVYKRAIRPDLYYGQMQITNKPLWPDTFTWRIFLNQIDDVRAFYIFRKYSMERDAGMIIPYMISVARLVMREFVYGLYEEAQWVDDNNRVDDDNELRVLYSESMPIDNIEKLAVVLGLNYDEAPQLPVKVILCDLMTFFQGIISETELEFKTQSDLSDFTVAALNQPATNQYKPLNGGCRQQIREFWSNDLIRDILIYEVCREQEFVGDRIETKDFYDKLKSLYSWGNQQTMGLLVHYFDRSQPSSKPALDNNKLFAAESRRFKASLARLRKECLKPVSLKNKVKIIIPLKYRGLRDSQMSNQISQTEFPILTYVAYKLEARKNSASVSLSLLEALKAKIPAAVDEFIEDWIASEEREQKTLAVAADLP